MKKSFRRALFDGLVLSRRPSVPVVQMAAALLSSLGVHRIQVNVPRTSPLFRAQGGEVVEIVLDDVMAPQLLATGAWQSEEVGFLSEHARRGPCVLIDIGANVGLITRQVLHSVPEVQLAVCFEPHPGNFSLLERNLAHLPQCRPIRAALGSSTGELNFYEDLYNMGNYSMNLEAMRGTDYRTSVVRCIEATDDALFEGVEPAMRDLPIVWKSDTQGFDESIAVHLSDSFWARVRAGVMEIWRIERPVFDRDRLRTLLSSFDVLRFGDEPRKALTVDEIIDFTSGTDGVARDLHFART